MTEAEEKRVRARGMLTAKQIIRNTSFVANRRTRYRNKYSPSILKKTGRINDMGINDVINSNNPNSPLNRTKVIGE